MSWHHSPTHRLNPPSRPNSQAHSSHGVDSDSSARAFILTAGTIHKQHFFSLPEHLTSLQSTLLNLVEKYNLALKAWALFSNHYHLILTTSSNSGDLVRFISHFHSQTARKLNQSQSYPGRNVWYQYWDTELTYHDSYMARLNYVINNPVRHGLVSEARNYPWCSARWFFENATPGHYKTVMTYKSDKVNVVDDFDSIVETPTQDLE